MEVRLRARCHPTEDREKIVAAIKDIFPDARIEGDDPVFAFTGSVDNFGALLKQFRIRDAARGVLRRGLDGDSTKFSLNKQVAAVGKVSFSEEAHPLGDIEVEIVSDDIEALIDSIAPSTRRKDLR